jgi:hypothetical protein
MGRWGDGARVDVVDTVDLVDAWLVGGCPSTVAGSPIRRLALLNRAIDRFAGCG